MQLQPISALLTDLYQLTMASGYWQSGKAEKEAVFHLFFRQNPFNGGYIVCSGLGMFLSYFAGLKFTQSDLDYLSQLNGGGPQPLFPKSFLDTLKALKWRVDIHAVAEGTVIFPHEPAVRVQGPLWQCQLLEALLLNLFNFHSLISTKASRIVLAAQNKPVLEFGLRRAQGLDGGVSASRAAYIGGCTATSNVMAAKIFNIPVRGTHAHSWVLSFKDEKTAFEQFSQHFGHNCILLVDTYNSLNGIQNAISVGKSLEKKGLRLQGIRLDSGDLAYLSRQARHLLDQAGLNDVKIMASNDLDENIIASLHSQGAPIDIWAVGSKLVTADRQPYMSGVYKLSALKDDNTHWKGVIKVSEDVNKISSPGILQTRRFFGADAQAVGDAVYNTQKPPTHKNNWEITHPNAMHLKKKLPTQATYQDLLNLVVKQGQIVYHNPELSLIRESVQANLKRFDPSIQRLTHPHRYPAGLEESLHQERLQLIAKNQNSHSNNTAEALHDLNL